MSTTTSNVGKKIQSVSFSFAGTTYLIKKINAGQGQSSDPVDVTALTDTVEQFLPGALVKNKEISVTLQGVVDPPDINTMGDIVIIRGDNDGSSTVTKTITIKDCILKDVTPPEPEAGGDRALNWVMTFQPSGHTASTSNT